MKLQKQLQTVTLFAGISFVIEEFNSCSLSKLIGNTLGIRTLPGYQYGDIIRGWFSVFFSGGDVAEDIHCHLRASLTYIPGNRVPSADMLLRGIPDSPTGFFCQMFAIGHVYYTKKRKPQVWRGVARGGKRIRDA
ncbi:MAG: hypothetical protein LBU37_03695 [Tannerellaceae bacterium]|jgi:hypothetical protein|nr:hypothetical protein [Tannerellaceae bacterium]